MYKRGQTGIGLVILGVIAIIAVIGLVLLFTRASNSGAMVSGTADTFFQNYQGIGNPYGPGPVGIGSQYPVPPVMRQQGGWTQPMTQMPAYGSVVRTTAQPPVLVWFQADYGAIDTTTYCWRDLFATNQASPQDFYRCYVTDPRGVEDPGHGFFPPSSPAYAKVPGQGVSQGLKGPGGRVFCFAPAGYDRDAIADRLEASLVNRPDRSDRWSVVTTNDGRKALLCDAGASVGGDFIFPQ